MQEIVVYLRRKMWLAGLGPTHRASYACRASYARRASHDGSANHARRTGCEWARWNCHAVIPHFLVPFPPAAAAPAPRAQAGVPCSRISCIGPKSADFSASNSCFWRAFPVPLCNLLHAHSPYLIMGPLSLAISRGILSLLKPVTGV